MATDPTGLFRFRDRDKVKRPAALIACLIVNGGQIPGHRGGVKVGHCDAGPTI
jgi:hypothetical protein